MPMKDYIAIAAQYQTDVLSGAQPACKWVRLACERNRRDLDRQRSEAFQYYFDPEAGRRRCLMAEMLPHVKGPKAIIIGQDDDGRPLWNPIVLEPWQCWILTTLFGWKRLDGRRRFRVALSLIPRKNAKSTLAAIVVLGMLVDDGESGAECYSAATTRDQAKAIAEIAWEMARRSPGFREHFGVRLGSKTTLTLTVPDSGGKFAPLSADANSLDGLNVSLAAIDELHAHRTAAVWNVLDTATGARAQPLIFAITTAGVDIGGVCHQKLAYLEKVLDGVFVDESFFGINYTIDPGDDIRRVDVQRKANPNYGVSVDAEDLARKINASAASPADLNNLLTKHFNVWIRTESSWMSATQWQTCAKPQLAELAPADRAEALLQQYRDCPCWIGVDLAEVRDIAALFALFRTGADTYAAVGRFYLPAATIDQSPIAELSGWVREGFIIETPGDQADFARIEDDIIAWSERFPNLKEIDFDRALAAHMQQDLKRRLEPRMGKDAVERFVVTVPQNVPEMDPAMKMTTRLVLGTKLVHDGNPAMAWMISNVVVERNYKDEIYPRKAGGKDSPNKIDGPVALWTAMSRAMRTPEPEKEYQIFVVGGGR
jgi:phage terminase large subunit-like protein